MRNKTLTKSVLILLLLSFCLSFFSGPVHAEEVTNGGFETGDFTGWSIGNLPTVTGAEHHSGSYSALTDYSCSFYQEPSGIDVEDITSFTVYVMKEAGSGNTYFTWTSEAGGDNYLLTSDFGSGAVGWTEVDLLEILLDEEATGELSDFGISRMSDYVVNWYFDDWSMDIGPEVTLVSGGLHNNVYFRNSEAEYGETNGYLATFDYGSSSTSVNFSITGDTVDLILDVSLIDEYGDTVAQIIAPEAWDCFVELDEDFSGTKMAGFELETSILMNVGLSAMQIKIWSLADDEETPTLRGTWITEALQYSGIENSTWVFVLPCTYTDTGSADISFSFGDYQSKAYINNVVWEEPNEFESIMGYLLSGNMIEGLFIFPFTYVLHEVFWLIIMLMAMVPLYIHHKNVGIIILFFILFGGSGGILTAFIPPPYVYAGWIFILLAMGSIFWRLTR